MHSFNTLLSLVGGQPVDETCEIDAIGIIADQVPPTGIFAAVPGTRAHGATFAKQSPAAAILTDPAGAAILAQDPNETRPVGVVEDVRAVLGTISAAIYGDPTQHMRVIGITGTSGKTTTSYLVEAMLLAAGRTVGLIGTTGTRINGRPVPTELTTPEAPKLQELFAQMRDEGVTDVVMEVSSHAIALGRVQGTHFDVQAFNNLSQDHLDFHHNMEEYFEAKAAWFKDVDPQRCIINIDDAWGRKLADRLPGATTISTAELDVRVDAQGVQHCADFSLQLPGRFNIANAVMALACAEHVGLERVAATKALSEVAVPGRMERIERGQNFLAVVDYAHKPAAVAAILDTLRAQTTGRVGIVLGAGGDRDTAKRPVMGAEAASRADLVIVTDDNPRSEDPATIRAAVLQGTQGHPAEVMEIGDRAAAIAAAVQWAQPGDAIVVAGKGHETGQLIAGVKHPFDDRVALAQALEQRVEQQ